MVKKQRGAKRWDVSRDGIKGRGLHLRQSLLSRKNEINSCSIVAAFHTSLQNEAKFAFQEV